MTTEKSVFEKYEAGEMILESQFEILSNYFAGLVTMHTFIDNIIC